MFTGIIEEVGRLHAVEHRDGSAAVTVACRTVVSDARPGDSIAVNGVCLTVTALPEEGFTADLMAETLDRTALGGLAVGAAVNLERALRADGRLGGHLVQGHVDGVAEVLAVESHPDWTLLRCSLPPAVALYVVEKGSITVDGTSLTVTAVDEATFGVGLIPHTLAATNHGRRSVGDRVNLEVDVIAKYVERMLRAGATTPYQPGGAA